MDNLKKINKILFITLFVFSIGVFGSYSKTTSKYVIDEYDNIVNKTDFKILTNSSIIDNTFSEVKDNTATFGFTFYRTAITNGEKIKEDTIDISFEGASINKCKIKDGGIEGFASKNGTNSYNKTNKGVKFTYKDTESNTTANKAVKVTYECEIDDSILTEDNRVKTRFIGVEKIKLNDGTEENFQIFRKTAVSNGEYVAPIPEDPVYLENFKKVQFIEKSLTRTLLREWITKYVDTYYKDTPQDITPFTHVDVIYGYIGFNDSNWNPNDIKGLSYDSTTKTYSFDDNILNYASTYINNSAQPKHLYFKKPAGREFTKLEIDNLFKDYYYTYYCGATPTSIDDEIFNFIVNKGGVSTIILNNNTIDGVSYDSYYNFVTLNKDAIYSTLHPNYSDIVLKNVSLVSSVLKDIAPVISNFVNYKFGITDFNEEYITKNTYLSTYISSLINASSPNSYYYLPLGDNKYLSMRIYKDDIDYIMHLDSFTTYTLEANVEKHAFVSMDKIYKDKNTVSADYDKLRSEFIKYIKALDSTYGTSFEANGASTQLDRVINAVISNVAAGKVNAKITGFEIKGDNSLKKASLYVRFDMTDTNPYASFLFDFDPNSITTIATTNTVTTNTTKTTSTTKSAPTTLTTTVKTTTKEYTDNKVESKVTGSNE